MKGLFPLFVLSATLCAAVQAREADALRARLSGCVKNVAVCNGCLPGCLLAAGDEAVPLAFGKVNGAKVAVAAATAYGKGRAVAVTHHGFFEKEVAQRDENVAFLRECLAWLAGGKAPAVVCLDAKRHAMKDCVARAVADWKGTRVASLRGYGELESLPSGAVVVTMPDAYPLADAAKLNAFIRRGGGVLAPVVGWGWHQISNGKPFSTESPFNAALGPAGLYTGGATVRGVARRGGAVGGEDVAPAPGGDPEVRDRRRAVAVASARRGAHARTAGLLDVPESLARAPGTQLAGQRGGRDVSWHSRQIRPARDARRVG